MECGKYIDIINHRDTQRFLVVAVRNLWFAFVFLFRCESNFFSRDTSRDERFKSESGCENPAILLQSKHVSLNYSFRCECESVGVCVLFFLLSFLALYKQTKSNIVAMCCSMFLRVSSIKRYSIYICVDRWIKFKMCINKCDLYSVAVVWTSESTFDFDLSLSVFSKLSCLFQ